MGFLDSGIGEGLNQATGTIAKTALNLAEFQQQARHMRALEANDTQRLAMQKTHYDSINQEREIEMRQKEVALAKAQEDIKPVDADLFLSIKGFSAGQIKYVKDVASKGGLIEQDGQYSYVPKKAGAEFLAKFIADPEHNVNLGRIGMQEIDAQRAQIKQALADPKLKPEDMQKLKLQDAELANKRTDLFHRTKLSQQEFDAKNKPIKENSKLLTPEEEAQQIRIAHAKREPRGSGGSSRGDKEVEKTVRAIEGHIKTRYTDMNKKLENDFKTADDATRQAIATRIENNNIEAEKALNTINQLRNGEITPQQVRWGGNKQPQKETQSKQVDIAQERKWAKEAIIAGKDRAEIAKNFKARTGQNL